MSKKRNTLTFGLGTIGRDMLYSMISMFLIFYLTDVLNLPDSTLLWLTGIMLFARVFDAVNDPIMGVIVDNTQSRYGKFKPWIAGGALVSGAFTILLFTDLGWRGAPFIIAFAVIYLMWGISFTANDISYWSMLPSLTTSQSEREKMGSFARICANIGMFAVVAGIEPITAAMNVQIGDMSKTYMFLAIAIVVIMWVGQSITVFGVREPKGVYKKESATTLKGMLKVIFKNDQLLVTGIALVLFMIGYVTTTSFGLYFFKYAYGDEGMFSIFALIVGVCQILGLSVFPLFSKRFTRKQLYTGGTILVVAGYLMFFFSPMDMLYLGIAGVLLFLGQSFIQILMLMFLADSIEYGQWKLGRRNESVTFAIQPFINKMGGAISSGIVGLTVVFSGMSTAESAADMTSEGLLIMKSAMLFIPLIFIVAGYIIYMKKYKIDKAMFDKIIADLKERGDIKDEETA